MRLLSYFFQLKKTVDELNAALEAKGELLQRCHELDAQVNIFFLTEF